MKEMLIQGKTLVMDDEDYAFLKDKFIELRGKNGVYYPVLNLHRMHFKDLEEGVVVDHINRNTLDFSTSNLRLANYSENNANRGPIEGASSKYKGVKLDKKSDCWVVEITKGNIYLFLGRYNKADEKEAAIAYDMAAIYLHKDFVYLNFPYTTYKDLDIKQELFKLLVRKPINNPTGYRGVCLDRRCKGPKPYYATVKRDKRSVTLGTFYSAVEAAHARDNWYRKHGIYSYTQLNFPTIDEVLPKIVEEGNTMIVDQKCVDIVKDFEGFRAKPYLDAVGIPTIGYGSTFYADGTKVTLKDPPIGESEAENLTRLVLNTIAKQVNSLVSVELSTNQFSALVSFTYNVGVGAFKTSTLRRLINEGAYDKAPEQFMRWNKAGGKVLPGLTRRRKAEVDLWNLA